MQCSSDLITQPPTFLSEWCWFRKIGLSGTIASSSSKHQTSYTVSLSSIFPWIFRHYALSIELLLLLSRMHKSSIQWGPGSLTIKHIVPEDALIMIACEQADMPVVQSLLDDRKASLNDVTRKGRTPLMVILLIFYYVHLIEGRSLICLSLRLKVKVVRWSNY